MNGEQIHSFCWTFSDREKRNFSVASKKDWNKVAPEFIFCRNVEVIDDSKSVQVKNLIDINKK